VALAGLVVEHALEDDVVLVDVFLGHDGQSSSLVLTPQLAGTSRT
jgi:hypothetical protein